MSNPTPHDSLPLELGRITFPPGILLLSGRSLNESRRLVTGPTIAPDVTRSVLADIRNYFAHQGSIPTLVDFESTEVREDYTQRIAQRVGIDVSQYSVLNVHRIGIEAPVRYVFEELVRWEGDSPYWPNHVATLKDMEDTPGSLRVVLFGRSVGRWLGSVSGDRLGTLFQMHARTVRDVPGGSDLDNARYLLWDCRGGYPIGFFSVFVRSPIAARDEAEPTQLFFAVGFNPHGRRFLSHIRPIRRTWEAIHNRVTTNVLNRFKRLCERNFTSAQDGEEFNTGAVPVYEPRGA